MPKARGGKGKRALGPRRKSPIGKQLKPIKGNLVKKITKRG